MVDEDVSVSHEENQGLSKCLGISFDRFGAIEKRWQENDASSSKRKRREKT
jgi:hypothetical protein